MEAYMAYGKYLREDDTVSFVTKALGYVWVAHDWYDNLDRGDQRFVIAWSAMLLGFAALGAARQIGII